MDQTVLIGEAEKLASLGWRVCPSSRELKHPPYAKWHVLATNEVAKVGGMFAYYKDCDAVSVQFGPKSNLIDLDFDSADSYHQFSEKFLLPDGLNGLEDVVRPPMFLSGSRGTPHLLFEFNRRLPEKANLSLRDAGYEIDAKLGWNNLGSQSIFPPSAGYLWCEDRSPWEVALPELPPLAIDLIRRCAAGLYRDGVLHAANAAPLFDRPSRAPAARPAVAEAVTSEAAALLEELGIDPTESLARSDQHWERISGGVDEGERHNATMSFLGRRAFEMPRLKLAKLHEAAEAYNSTNRPPLPAGELNQMVRDVFARELRKRQSAAGETTRTDSDDQADRETREIVDQVVGGGGRVAPHNPAESIPPFPGAPESPSDASEDGEVPEQGGEGPDAGAGQHGPQMRLERIECGSDPVEWRLYSDGGLFDRTPHGYVPLASAELLSGPKTIQAIVECGGRLPVDHGQFRRVWAQIHQRLLETATIVQRHKSMSLRSRLARSIYDILEGSLADCVTKIGQRSQGTAIDGESVSDSRVVGVELADGGWAFSWTPLLGRVRALHGPEATSTLVREVLEWAGVRHDYHAKGDGSRRRLKLLTEAAQDRLLDLANGED